MASFAPFAGYQDVESIWRPLSAAEQSLAESWIDEASQQVRDEVPDVDDLDVDERITAGSLQAETVRSVVARMVRRVLMNPEGARQRSETIDDYQESITIDTARSSGEMYITDREMKRLLGVHGGRKAFEISTRADPQLVPVFEFYPWDVIPS